MSEQNNSLKELRVYPHNKSVLDTIQKKQGKKLRIIDVANHPVNTLAKKNTRFSMAKIAGSKAVTSHKYKALETESSQVRLKQSLPSIHMKSREDHVDAAPTFGSDYGDS